MTCGLRLLCVCRWHDAPPPTTFSDDEAASLSRPQAHLGPSQPPCYVLNTAISAAALQPAAAAETGAAQTAAQTAAQRAAVSAAAQSAPADPGAGALASAPAAVSAHHAVAEPAALAPAETAAKNAAVFAAAQSAPPANHGAGALAPVPAAVSAAALRAVAEPAAVAPAVSAASRLSTAEIADLARIECSGRGHVSGPECMSRGHARGSGLSENGAVKHVISPPKPAAVTAPIEHDRDENPEPSLEWLAAISAACMIFSFVHGVLLPRHLGGETPSEAICQGARGWNARSPVIW